MARISMSDMIEAVKAHAAAHYEEDGWDVVVEAFDDEDIAEEIGNARSVNGAIKRVRECCMTRKAYADDIRAAGDADHDWWNDEDEEPRLSVESKVRDLTDAQLEDELDSLAGLGYEPGDGAFGTAIANYDRALQAEWNRRNPKPKPAPQPVTPHDDIPF